MNRKKFKAPKLLKSLLNRIQPPKSHGRPGMSLSIYLTVQFIKDKFKSSNNFFNRSGYHNNPISSPREKLLVTRELDPRPGLGLKLSDGGASFPNDGACCGIGYEKPNVRLLLRRVLKKKSIAINHHQAQDTDPIFTMLGKQF